jgi:hypothetical protein
MNPSRPELQRLLKPEAGRIHLSFARVYPNRPVTPGSTFALLTITLFCARTYDTSPANALKEINFDAVEVPGNPEPALGPEPELNDPQPSQSNSNSLIPLLRLLLSPRMRFEDGAHQKENSYASSFDASTSR